MKMWKLVGFSLLCAIFLVCSKSVRAQVLNVSLRAGFDMIPTSSNDQTHGGDLPLGFNAGIRTQLWVLPRLAFEPEVQYTWMHYSSRSNKQNPAFVSMVAGEYNVMSARLAATIGSYSQYTTTTTSYIYIPLLIGYKINWFFMVSAGPEIGFLQANKSKIGMKANVITLPTTADVIERYTTTGSTDGLNKTLVGIDAAIQMHVSPRLSAELRYSRSLTPLERDISTTESYYNYIQFSFIYTLASL